MSSAYHSLSDKTIAVVVSALSNYLPAPHMEGFLRALDAAVLEAVTQATSVPAEG